MLETIYEDGYFAYHCHDEDCHTALCAHISDSAVEHLHMPQAPVPMRPFDPERPLLSLRASPMQGSVVGLPPCPHCGSRMFLKADYSVRNVMKEKMLHTFVSDGRVRGYAMELRYARSFRLLNMLYDVGKLKARPLLPVLPFDAIKQSELRGLPLDVVDAFWLPYALCGRVIDYEGIDQHLIALGGGMTPLLPIGTVLVHEKMRHGGELPPPSH